MGDATTAARRARRPRGAVEPAARQDYAGASLADIDEELLERALGRPAVDDLAALRQMERELERQGYLNRSDGRLELSPKAVRRLGADGAAPGVRRRSTPPAAATTTCADAGAAGELTGSSREWRFGDEQPLDVVRTVTNAVLRTAHEPRAEGERAVRHRRRRLRGRRDRAAHRRRGRAAGRPVLLDGAARHLGRGQVDGDGAALAGDDAVPAGRDRRSSGSPRTPRCCGRRRWPSCRWTRCRAPTCSTG